MKKAVYWMIWTLVLVAINIIAFPIALFSIFGTAEGTSIFSIDYLIAFSIILLANIISVQLFIAIRKQDQNGFLIGLVLAIMEVGSFVLLINSTADFMVCLALAAVSMIGGVILLIRSFVR